MNNILPFFLIKYYDSSLGWLVWLLIIEVSFLILRTKILMELNTTKIPEQRQKTMKLWPFLSSATAGLVFRLSANDSVHQS